MTSMHFDSRSSLMHKSYDSRTFFKTRKAQAVERLLRLLYRRAAPDYRLVHRFRQWQINDLNEVLEGIFVQSCEKNKSYRKDVLTLLDGKVRRDLTVAVRRWRLFTLAVRREKLTPEALAGAARLARQMTAVGLRSWPRRDFPMFYQRGDPSNRVFLLCHAFAVWKSRATGFLLYQSRRETGAVRLAQVLHFRVKPHLLHSLDQLSCKSGWRLPLQCLCPTLRRLRDKKLREGWTGLQKKDLEQHSETDMLARGLALVAAVARVMQRRGFKFQTLERPPPPSDLDRYKAGLSRLCARLKTNHANVRLRCLSTWQSAVTPLQLSPQFDIDSSIIHNQMRIALLLEQQIYTRRQQSFALSQKRKLLRFFAVVKKGLRLFLDKWRRYRCSEDRDEDVLYEYVRFLEEQNGIEHSRVPNRRR